MMQRRAWRAGRPNMRWAEVSLFKPSTPGQPTPSLSQPEDPQMDFFKR